jgi:dTDP-4-dehydrorhamnose reductase
MNNNSTPTDSRERFCNPELWGGIECTINRVGDQYRDQLLYSGHYYRDQDIESINSLGVTALRYPILWERHESEKGKTLDWSWIERQLNLLREKKIQPIAGLLHHGSGPSFTNLLDEKFPIHLAEYASQVAQKFPWIEYYTPVNEPLTTSRFSGLYGLWYPHHYDEESFLKMLINQVRGIILSMREIRKVNPNAKLVQTEDLAKVHSTKRLRYQAKFENHRAWLTWDLLHGRVNDNHPLWKYFLKHGIDESSLNFFMENPCVPYIMGLNYYITSERYLDGNLKRYPSHTYGGNGKHSYADVEAVRVSERAGLYHLLQEAWTRYRTPIAITEAHLNCTREEQMRWFYEIWQTSCQAKKSGVDLRAVTAWSLFGSFDWNTLLTQENRHYETGVFELKNNSLRPTAFTKMIKSLGANETKEHPVLHTKGWWYRNDRFVIEPRTAKEFGEKKPATPLLIIGKYGTLASAFIRICNQRGIHHVALSRNDLNIASSKNLKTAIDLYKPWAIVNTAGYVMVDEAENNLEECFLTNTHAPANLASICRDAGIRFMTFSSDLVFGGEKRSPYIEGDQVKPLNVYGESKAKCENLVSLNDPSALIIRTSSFFGPWDRYNFAYQVLQSLQTRTPFAAVDDVVISPTYVPDLVHQTLDLLIDEESGIWHVTNDGVASWADFAEEVASRAGFARQKIKISTSSQMCWKATRPPYSVLQSSRGLKLPTLDHAIERFFKEKI